MAVPIVSAAASKLESRFVLNALVPTLVFGTFATATLLDGFVGLDVVVDWFVELPTAVAVLIPFAIVAAAWLVAALIASQFDRIVTVFEGYPLVSLNAWLAHRRGLGWLADRIGVPGVQAHVRRRRRLERDVEAGRWRPNELSDLYTSREDLLLPTRLGNILRAAELYPFERYGIDFTILWTRLAFLVPPHVLADIERTIIQYQLPLVISGWLSVVSVCSLPLVWAGEAWRFFVLFGLASTGALASYAWSLRSAQHYGDLVRSVFDIYREELRTKWPAILTADLERQDFDRLQNFIASGRVSVTADTDTTFPRSDATDRSTDMPGTRARGRSPIVPQVRLSTYAIVGIGIVLFAAVCVLTLRRVEVAVATSTVAPFESVTIEPATRPLYQVGRVRAPSDLTRKTVITTRAVRAGEVLDSSSYVTVDAGIASGAIVSVADATIADNPLQLEAGDPVLLAVEAKADFATDALCADDDGVRRDRVVRGMVLIRPDRTGQIVVGIDGPERAAIAQCFDLASVRVLRPGS